MLYTQIACRVQHTLLCRFVGYIYTPLGYITYTNFISSSLLLLLFLQYDHEHPFPASSLPSLLALRGEEISAPNRHPPSPSTLTSPLTTARTITSESNCLLIVVQDKRLASRKQNIQRSHLTSPLVNIKRICHARTLFCAHFSFLSLSHAYTHFHTPPPPSAPTRKEADEFKDNR